MMQFETLYSENKSTASFSLFSANTLWHSTVNCMHRHRVISTERLNPMNGAVSQTREPGWNLMLSKTNCACADYLINFSAFYHSLTMQCCFSLLIRTQLISSTANKGRKEWDGTSWDTYDSPSESNDESTRIGQESTLECRYQLICFINVKLKGRQVF